MTILYSQYPETDKHWYKTKGKHGIQSKNANKILAATYRCRYTQRNRRSKMNSWWRKANETSIFCESCSAFMTAIVDKMAEFQPLCSACDCEDPAAMKPIIRMNTASNKLIAHRKMVGSRHETIRHRKQTKINKNSAVFHRKNAANLESFFIATHHESASIENPAIRYASKQETNSHESQEKRRENGDILRRKAVGKLKSVSVGKYLLLGGTGFGICRLAVTDTKPVWSTMRITFRTKRGNWHGFGIWPLTGEGELYSHCTSHRSSHDY